MKSTSYEVIFESFTERHYIRTFAKKYKGAWDVTQRIIAEEFRQVDLLFLKNTAETIIDSKEIKICKTEFKIAGTQESRHGSGNRCIIAVQKSSAIVYVLLVYSKTNLRGTNETAEWRKIIKDNYPSYRAFL